MDISPAASLNRRLNNNKKDTNIKGRGKTILSNIYEGSVFVLLSKIYATNVCGKSALSKVAKDCASRALTITMIMKTAKIYNVNPIETSGFDFTIMLLSVSEMYYRCGSD